MKYLAGLIVSLALVSGTALAQGIYPGDAVRVNGEAIDEGRLS